MLSLEQIQDKAIQLLSKIPEFDKSKIEADIKDYFVHKNSYYFHSSIQIEDNAYHYRAFERGECIEHRVRYSDSRRIAYEKCMELFALIGEPFEQINLNRINKILARFPYDDSPDRALNYFIEKPYRDRNRGIADFENVFLICCIKFGLLLHISATSGH